MTDDSHLKPGDSEDLNFWGSALAEEGSTSPPQCQVWTEVQDSHLAPTGPRSWGRRAPHYCWAGAGLQADPELPHDRQRQSVTVPPPTLSGRGPCCQGWKRKSWPAPRPLLTLLPGGQRRASQETQQWTEAQASPVDAPEAKEGVHYDSEWKAVLPTHSAFLPRCSGVGEWSILVRLEVCWLPTQLCWFSELFRWSKVATA